MNDRPPLLIGCLAGFLAVTLGAATGSAQQAGNSPPTNGDSATTTAENEATTVAGDELLGTCVARLLEGPSVRADLRQEVNLFGTAFVGHGEYLQLGQGENFRMRLELTLEVGRTRGTLQQVCDGQQLWTVTEIAHTGDDAAAAIRPQVVSLNVAQARRAIEAGVAAGALPEYLGARLPLGGLADLLEGIRSAWTFESVEESDLQDRPVYVLRGAWRTDVFEAIAGPDVDFASLPPYVPDRCVLYLDREHGIPYRVEFVRSGATGGRTRPLLTIELQEVAIGAELDVTDFLYTPPSDAAVMDITEEFVLGLQQGLQQGAPEEQGGDSAPERP